MAVDVARARQILGEEAEGVSDEEIQRMLDILHVLSEELLDELEKEVYRDTHISSDN